MPTYSIQHLAFVSIASLLAGLLLSSVYHYITKRQWEKQWDWVRSHSITKIAAAVEAGTVKLPYNTKFLVAKIGDAVYLTATKGETCAMDKASEQLVHDLIAIGLPRDGEYGKCSSDLMTINEMKEKGLY